MADDKKIPAETVEKVAALDDKVAQLVEAKPAQEKVVQIVLPRRAKICFKKLEANAQLPQHATPGSAGLDIRSIEQVLIHPGERVAVRTGVAVGLPAGLEMQVRPRSGLALKQGLTVFNAPGTIDSDYRGEIKVLLINLSDQVQTIAVGDRIAQLVINTYVMADPAVFVEDLDETARGAGGFGSTGVK